MVKSMNGEIDRSEVKRKGGRKKLNRVLKEMIGTLVYLLIVLGTDCFMLLKGRFEMARALRRYWGSSVIAVGLLLVIHVSFPDSLAVIFPMVYSPYVVLVPVIEWLGMPENAWWVSGFVAAFCLVNWAVCRFCVRDCGC